jgi:hypothetical protein
VTGRAPGNQDAAAPINRMAPHPCLALIATMALAGIIALGCAGHSEAAGPLRVTIVLVAK